ncbi:MAG: hypothetical protein HQL81_09670 [Magnetococcales bacterium]|nr:hypothetical protein [Magnetococcales bacterium]
MEQELTSQLIAFVQVIFIDLVLAGDNAIVVGMAAPSVPMEYRRKVIFWGTGAAIALRIVFALITTQLLAIVGLTLAGGLLLLFVVWQMYRELRTHGKDEVTPGYTVPRFKWIYCPQISPSVPRFRPPGRLFLRYKYNQNFQWLRVMVRKCI